MLKKILRAAAAGAAFVVVYLVCLYAVQDYLIFYPDRFYAGPSSAGAPAFEERPLVTADGHLIMAWYAKGDADKPAILFFHGNAGQLATFAPHLKAYIDAGYPVFMPEYRGFGLSGGRLSEETMYADAVVAFNYLKDRLGHDKIVVFGYSMGTAAASAAAVLFPGTRGRRQAGSPGSAGIEKPFAIKPFYCRLSGAAAGCSRQ